MIPLGKFYDHGDGVEAGRPARLESLQGHRRRQAHDRESRRHDSVRRRSDARARFGRPGDRQPDQWRRTQSALRQCRADGARPRPRTSAWSVSRSPMAISSSRAWAISTGRARWRLACPVNKLGHGQSLHHQPPRRARQFRRAGVARRDQAAGDRRQQRAAQGPRPDRRPRPSLYRAITRPTSAIRICGWRSFPASKASGRAICR